MFSTKQYRAIEHPDGELWLVQERSFGAWRTTISVYGPQSAQDTLDRLANPTILYPKVQRPSQPAPAAYAP